MQVYELARYDLICLVQDDNDSNGHPSLPTGSRRRVEETLQLVLLNPDAWDAHCKMLHEHVNVERHHWLLTEDERHTVCKNGLAVLEDSRLAALVLNRIALLDLSRAIEDQVLEESGDVSDAWLNIALRHGRQLLQEDGRPEHPGSRLVDAAIESLGVPEFYPGGVSKPPKDEKQASKQSTETVSQSTGITFQQRQQGTWQTEKYLDVPMEMTVDTSPYSLALDDPKSTDHSFVMEIGLSFPGQPVAIKLTFAFANFDAPPPTSVGCLPELVVDSLDVERQACTLIVEQKDRRHVFKEVADGTFEPLDIELDNAVAKFCLSIGDIRMCFEFDLPRLQKQIFDALS